MIKPLWLRIFKHHLHGDCSSGILREGPWDLPDAARRPRTCWTLRNTTEMVEMEIGEKHLLIFRILQTSFQYALFCQSVNEHCALIYWYTVLYSFWACNGDEPALLRHRAQLQTGQKGVVDLSVWWSEIFWNIYLGPLSNGRSTACESWINVQGRFKVQVESLRANLQVQTKYIYQVNFLVLLQFQLNPHESTNLTESNSQS